jgi:hypothetical protein
MPTAAPSRGPTAYHAGEQLPVIITGHPSRAVELEPAIFAGPHTQQARVDLPHRGEMYPTGVTQTRDNSDPKLV